MSEYKWRIDKIPGWVIAYLDQENIPVDFKVRELSDEQRLMLSILMRLIQLEEKGLIRAEYEPGVGVTFEITPRGKEEVRRR